MRAEKKAADIELWCPICERHFKVRPRKWEQKYRSRRCNFRALREDWPSLHREISQDRNYPGYVDGVYQHDDGEDE